MSKLKVKSGLTNPSSPTGTTSYIRTYCMYVYACTTSTAQQWNIQTKRDRLIELHNNNHNDSHDINLQKVQIFVIEYLLVLLADAGFY